MSATTMVVLFPIRGTYSRAYVENEFNGKTFVSKQVLQDEIAQYINKWCNDVYISDIIIYDNVGEFAIMLNDEEYPTDYWVAFVNVG